MKKVIAIGLVASTMLAGIYLVPDKDVYLNSDVNAKEARNVITAVESAGMFQTINLVLESNGGEVRQEAVIKHVLGKHYNSEVLGFAASAAAMLFIGGKKRVMHSDSRVLFHEVRIHISSKVYITVTDMAYVHSRHFTKTHKFNESLEAVYKERFVMMSMMGQTYTKVDFAQELYEYLRSKASEEDLGELVKDMIDTHLKDIKIISDKTGMTVEEVRKKVMIPNVDKVMTAEEALKLGIATKVVG